MIRRTAFILSAALATSAFAASWPEHPILHAVRVSVPPLIDGDLSDPAWRNAPEFTDFTQHDPEDGKPATLRTSVRIAYDDRAIYFGAKMSDSARPTALPARRDTFNQSDFLSINLDPQRDRLSGSAFTINPANVQVDTVLYNDIGEDPSWDGVWESATKIVPDGWIAEVRIPFSQLRFADKPVHVWGVNITRRITRTNEIARIVNTKKGETGFVSHFADIIGLEGIHRGRSLEIVPYAVARSDVRTRIDSNDPLSQRQDQRGEGGLDLKYALTPRLTLTGTINPDFGQVEVDPAVVNLTQFETFYPEKRPFFTEGVDLFRFGDTPAPSHFNFFFPPQPFYSRRIGRAPQAAPDADFVSSPAQTRILGAAKLSGKLGNGWSLGVLDALTNSEHARFVSDGILQRQQVEPMSNYLVSRATKEAGDGSRLGFLLTSVERRLSADLLSLRKSATTGGIDGYKSFAGKSWILEGSGLVSHVTGSAGAIKLTQESPSRYYQRPDAGHIALDPTRTSLDGWAGRLMLSKATGLWRPILQVQAYSPGFETNDAGFMQRTDIVSSHALTQYVDQTPTAHFRERTFWFGTWQNRNFDGDTIERGAFVEHFAILPTYWRYSASFFAVASALSDRLTRGGPLVRTPRAWNSDLELDSDDRKQLNFSLIGHFEGSDDGSYVHNGGIVLNARPRPNLQLSLSPQITFSHDYTQYVTAFADAAATRTYGQRYVFANIEQRSFELGARADWTFNSRLSFQVYLQPFVASGHYHDYHALAAARTRDFTPYAYDGNPDFNFRSVRGSAVARWEFRPGSALYIAWNENRAGVAPVGDFRLRRDLRAIPNAPSHDVFLVKVSYWLPM